MTLAPVRLFLGTRRRPFTPSLPNNGGDKCWRCPHVWHRLGCRVDACGCSSAWVDPTVIARIGARA